jgi:hypothetical protein
LGIAEVGVNKVEATEVARTIVDALRELTYQELVDRYLDSSEHRDVLGESGVSYQTETQALWDTGEPGNLRVLVSIDDRGWKAWSPLLFSFIKAPDGSFVGD